MVKATEKKKREVETAQGPVKLERPYFYCPGCHEGFFPLDEALELSQRRKQYDLQRKGLKLLAEVPFERASELFEELTGIPFSDHALHELFAQFSDEVTIDEVIPSREEIEERIGQVSSPGKWRPILVVACDGAMAPTRPQGGRSEKRGLGEYREAKGFRLYLG